MFGDLTQVDLVGGHAIRRQLDADFLGPNAVQLDARHTLNPLDPTPQVAIEHVVGVGEIPVGRDSQDENRLVAGVELLKANAL